jgi:hypothetical protein
MMKMKQLLIIIVAVCVTSLTASAQYTETKEIKKHFAVTSETRIEISNKYGTIELNTWNKDSVVVEIRIEVEERKRSKLDQSMGKIDFDFTDNQHFLVIRTQVGKNMSTLEKEFLKFKETILQSSGNMKIDYSVWLPQSNELRVENQFGDIFIGDYTGDVEIDLSNGNLKSHDFEGNLNLTLNFADATINQVNSGWVESNYSDVYIKKAEFLRIDSKSSDFEILEINEMDADSRRDKFRIRIVDMIEARGSFSNFRLNEFNDRLILRTEYGDIDIEKTAPDFSNIFIESKSTDINLYVSPEANFGFEITHADADLDFCPEMQITDEENLESDEEKMKFHGNFGNNQADEPKLFINATSGELKIFCR